MNEDPIDIERELERIFAAAAEGVSHPSPPSKGWISQKRRELSLPRAGKLGPLAAALGRLIESVGMKERFTAQKAVVYWRMVVGTEIAAVTRALYIRDGVMSVRVKTGAQAWKTELAHIKGDIIQKLNQAVGAEVVKDIRFS